MAGGGSGGGEGGGKPSPGSKGSQQGGSQKGGSKKGDSKSSGAIAGKKGGDSGSAGKGGDPQGQSPKKGPGSGAQDTEIGKAPSGGGEGAASKVSGPDAGSTTGEKNGKKLTSGNKSLPVLDGTDLDPEKLPKTGNQDKKPDALLVVPGKEEDVGKGEIMNVAVLGKDDGSEKNGAEKNRPERTHSSRPGDGKHGEDASTAKGEKRRRPGEGEQIIRLRNRGQDGNFSDVLGPRGAIAGKRLVPGLKTSRTRTHVILQAEDVRVEEKDPVARQIVPEEYRNSLKAILEGGK